MEKEMIEQNSTDMCQKGRLIGVGTGPGDPELVTRKAWQAITTAKVIAYPAPDSGVSFARSIVADAIGEGVSEIPMVVPMRSGRAPAQTIYDDGAAAISSHLDAGSDVVVLCEGDPLFYGSFMYLLARLRTHYEVEIIPGITAMTACASAVHHPLVAREDMMSILPATMSDEALADAISAAQGVAIMKVGRHITRLKALLERLGYLAQAHYVSHASLPHQKKMPLCDATDDAPYFSMILLYKGDDPWI